MSFFKNILSDLVGDTVADTLTSVTKSFAKDAGKEAAKGAMNAAAKNASERAVNRAIDKASESINRPSALQTPPPPPVPTFESLSVMVAVNGESYGPYEKNTLMEMIRNGSLTRETYVFIEGMSDWEMAAEVEEVAVLFTSTAPTPPVPPKPWANSNSATLEEKDSDSPFSPRLNKLITAAVADGEISDLERQVLIRNAQQEGVAMDEFVIVLEARLYEQRRMLAKQEEEKKQRAESLKAQQEAAARMNHAPAAARPSNREMTKCPHCGAPIKALATACPSCGHDYPNVAAEKTTAWEKLSMQIAEIQNKPKDVVSSVFALAMQTEDRQIAQAIKGCSIPSNKDELFEFFSSCAPLAKKGLFAGAAERNQSTCKAYYQKAQQILLRARIVMKDDPQTLAQMEEIAKQYKIKV